MIRIFVALALTACHVPPETRPAEPPRDQVARAFDLAAAGAALARDAGAAAGDDKACAAGAVLEAAAAFGRGVFLAVDDLADGRRSASFPGPTWSASDCFVDDGPRGDLRPELVALASSSIGFVGVALDASGLQSSDCAAATVARQVVAWFARVPDAVADTVRHGGLDGRFPDLVVDLSACRP